MNPEDDNLDVEKLRMTPEQFADYYAAREKEAERLRRELDEALDSPANA